MKELFFHIGTPKTGSSALQVFLARNGTALSGQSVDYLQIGEIGLGAQGKISSGNGAFFARSLFPANAPARMKDPERYISEFFNMVEQSDADVGIISSEMFIDVDGMAFANIVARLAAKGVVARAFYFIRSQVQFMCSAYMQQVKRHGCTEEPAAYVGRAYKHVPFLRHYSFYQKMCGIFGRENVICRTYDVAATQKTGLFSVFINALSINPKGLDKEINDINTSMAPKEIAIMLLINRFRPRMKFSDVVVENAAAFGSVAAGQTHNILPISLIKEIDGFFANENIAMAEAYFQRHELFPPAAAVQEPDTVAVNALTPDDLIIFFGGLLVRYDDRIAKLEEQVTLMARLGRG